MRILALLGLAFALGACGGEEPSPQPPAAGTPAPGGGLSIVEARASTLEGPLMVKGYVLADREHVRLCDALAESNPPQCGGPSLVVEDFDLAEVDDLKEAQGVRWSERPVSLLGDVEGDVLRVSKTAR